MAAPKGPSKYRPEVVEKILDRVRAGVPRKYAWAAAGISHETFYNWIEKYVDFVEALTKAEADAVARNAALVERHALKDWKAASWWLERRAPEEFGRQEKIEVTMPILILDSNGRRPTEIQAPS